MTLNLKIYRNSTELTNLNGIPIYMYDMIDAALRGKLNVFLQGDTGSGKTQLVRDVMNEFGTTHGNSKFAEKIKDKLEYKGQLAVESMRGFSPDNSLFILGRNDMQSRELFERINLGKLYAKQKYNLEPLVNPDTGELEWYYPDFQDGNLLYRKLTKEQVNRVRTKLETLSGTTEDVRELTDKVNVNFIAVDELPNCVPSVRAQLFNLFDGFIEIGGRAYPLGGDYCIGIATGNIGQQFTESSNELGRALRDRMHLIIDTDYFRPQPIDTFDILARDQNPRVNFAAESLEDRSSEVIQRHKELKAKEIPFEKYLIAAYLVHALDYLEGDRSKIGLKSGWPNELKVHEAGSDAALILPVSPRAAKSIVTLSQALDEITREKGAKDQDYFNSMMAAFRFVSAYSGILNESLVRNTYGENHYSAMDAVIDSTRAEFDSHKEDIAAGMYMADEGKKDKKLLDKFSGRWNFMKSLLEKFAERK